MEGESSNYKDTKADANKTKLLLAGGLSGAVSRSAVAPLSRTTVLFQVQVMRERSGVPDSYYRSVWSALKSMFTNEGVHGLFKGNGTHLLKKVPFSSIKFFSYEFYKQRLTPSNQEDARVWRRLIAGGLAALTAVVCTYPLDLVQTQLTVQTTTHRYNGIVDTLVKIVRQEGFLQMYRGLSVTCISTVPYISINMTIWEYLKQAASLSGYSLLLLSSSLSSSSNYPSSQESLSGQYPPRVSPWVSAACGGISGAIASTITFPLDVLRRNMQLNSRIPGKQRLYEGYADVIKKIWLRDGARGFFRGIYPHYLTVIPIVSISFGSYDLLKLFLRVT